MTETQRTLFFLSSTFDDVTKGIRSRIKYELFNKIGYIYAQNKGELGLFDYELAIPRGAPEYEIINDCLRKIDKCHIFIGIISLKYGTMLSKIIKTLDKIEDKYCAHILNSGGMNISMLETELTYACVKESCVKFFYVDKRVLDIKDKIDDDFKKINQLCITLRHKYSQNLIYFTSEDELIQLILNNICEYLFPDVEFTNMLSSNIHNNYNSLCSRKNIYYSYREVEITSLNNYLSYENKSPFLLFGNEGTGKTTLLLNWAASVNKDKFLVYEFYTELGGKYADIKHICKNITNDLTSMGIYDNLSKSLCKSVKNNADLQIEQFNEFINIVELLGKIKSKNFLLILDSIENIYKYDTMNKYWWIPIHLPTNVYIVISTADKDIWMQFSTEKKQLIDINKPSKAYLSSIINNFTNLHGKELMHNTLLRVLDINNELLLNPMYIITTLEELRLAADYQSIDRMIDKFIQLSSMEELFYLILNCLEARYTRKFISVFFQIVNLSREGVSFDEIKVIFDINRFHNFQLEALYLETFYLFIDKDSKLIISNKTLRHAINERYKADEYAIRNLLIGYYEKMQVDSSLDICWQYLYTKNISKVVIFLESPINTLYLFNHDEIMFLKVIKFIGTENCDRVVRLWMIELESNLSSSYLDILNIIIRLEYTQEAISICKLINSKLSNNNSIEHQILGSNYLSIAYCLQKSGRFQDAFIYYNKALEVGKKIYKEESIEMRSIYTGLAEIYKDKRHQDTVKYNLKVIDISEFLYEKDCYETILPLNSISEYYYFVGEINKASKYINEAERLAERFLTKNHPWLAKIYNTKSLILKLGNQWDEAEKYMIKVHENINGNFDYLDVATLNCYNMVEFYYERKEYDRETQVFKQYMKSKLTDNKKGLGKMLQQRGIHLFNRFNKEKRGRSYIYLNRSKKIYEECNYCNSIEVAETYKYLAFYFWEKGDSENVKIAKDFQKKEFELLNTNKDFVSMKKMINSWINMAYILFSLGRFDEALCIIETHYDYYYENIDINNNDFKYALGLGVEICNRKINSQLCSYYFNLKNKYLEVLKSPKMLHDTN